jgi:hypothetical protein
VACEHDKKTNTREPTYSAFKTQTQPVAHELDPRQQATPRVLDVLLADVLQTKEPRL